MPPKLPIALLALRIGVVVVFAIWIADKFLRPDHTAAVYESFYKIGGLSTTLSYIIGVIQLLFTVGMLIGFKKRITYGGILLMHAISTLSSYKQYLAPFEGPSILFFAAWPMLSACYALYVLREHDTLLTIEK